YQVKEFTGITASPLIEGRFLILYICGKPAACVVALDMDSGREAWRALDDSFTYSSPIVVTDSGRRQLIVWTQEAVTSLDPRTGKIWWLRMALPDRSTTGARPRQGDLAFSGGMRSEGKGARGRAGTNGESPPGTQPALRPRHQAARGICRGQKSDWRRWKG